MRPVVDVGVDLVDSRIKVSAPHQVVVLEPIAEKRAITESVERGTPLHRPRLV